MKGVGNQVSFPQECFGFLNGAPLSKNGATNDTKMAELKILLFSGTAQRNTECKGSNDIARA